MTTLQDLLAQRAQLEAQIAQTQTRERTDAVARVKTLMMEHGLTIADLGVRGTKAPKTSPSTVAAKFRHSATGATWSGRGLQPKWLKAAISGGAKLEDFKI